eukprot:TRINITY_DN6006_c0_g1_i2.p1 TRINITY_DN6006_c0_g1~~TRINITY_DN6006_c0_g1_i2.p1  ORF type:complete len:259 (+),score=66.75 TRINITY_DN6006_c0_g1_i2:152-928(+)
MLGQKGEPSTPELLNPTSPPLTSPFSPSAFFAGGRGGVYSPLHTTHSTSVHAHDKENVLNGVGATHTTSTTTTTTSTTPTTASCASSGSSNTNSSAGTTTRSLTLVVGSRTAGPTGNLLKVPTLTLAQQLRCINCKINNKPQTTPLTPTATTQTTTNGGGLVPVSTSGLSAAGPIGEEPFGEGRVDWSGGNPIDETIGDTSQSGDDDENGWRALVMLEPTTEKNAMLAQAEQVLRRTEGGLQFRAGRGHSLSVRSSLF